jgi:hypothetical protein
MENDTKSRRLKKQAEWKENINEILSCRTNIGYNCLPVKSKC